MGFVYLGILAAAFAIGGMAGVQRAWNTTLDAARRVLASRIFIGLIASIITALVLPIVFALIGLSLRHKYGPDVVRTVIFMGTILSMAILGAIALFANFFAEVIVVAFPLRVFERMRNGIYYVSAGSAMWILFLNAWLMVLGPFASNEGLAALVVGGLLYWSVMAYYNKPTKWLPKVAMTTAGVLMVWFVVGSIPGSFWLIHGLPNLRPKINFWIGVDNLKLDRVEKARWEGIEAFCSRGFDVLKGKMAGATMQEMRTYGSILERMETACGKGELATLQRLELEINAL